MEGDGGDIYQLRQLKKMRNNPDWRYEGKSRTEIENEVKARSSVLLSKRHTISEKSGRKIRFNITEKDIEHLVSDATGRAKGTLYISDIPNLHRSFKSAIFVRSNKEAKKRRKESILSLL